uniref:Uncharacterized protein n=1 Tax=Timema genevievae TaxID=629358 RepID=A0A7R9JND9_TIMGE|nr:unnamed protein product [Timema genevievae]
MTVMIGEYFVCQYSTSEGPLFRSHLWTCGRYIELVEKFPDSNKLHCVLLPVQVMDIHARNQIRDPYLRRQGRYRLSQAYDQRISPGIRHSGKLSYTLRLSLLHPTLSLVEEFE